MGTYQILSFLHPVPFIFEKISVTIIGFYSNGKVVSLYGKSDRRGKNKNQFNGNGIVFLRNGINHQSDRILFLF